MNFHFENKDSEDEQKSLVLQDIHVIRRVLRDHFSCGYTGIGPASLAAFERKIEVLSHTTVLKRSRSTKTCNVAFALVTCAFLMQYIGFLALSQRHASETCSPCGVNVTHKI